MCVGEKDWTEVGYEVTLYFGKVLLCRYMSEGRCVVARIRFGQGERNVFFENTNSVHAQLYCEQPYHVSSSNFSTLIRYSNIS